MHLANNLWSAITYLASWLTLSPFHGNEAQQPLPGRFGSVADANAAIIPENLGYPIFKPPGGRPRYEGSEFTCEYPEMSGWEFCSTPGDRGCWLRHPNGSRYDINTNYEIHAPKGIERYYSFEITDGTWNADGLTANDTKLVNGQYPGPWVQACWGDTIIVNVTNKLGFNGTAIHWHGIRQEHTMPMDGVPGITQCPIAPGDHFVYNFSAIQYGSSWYHSHFSVQYADGLLGPITLHGPSTGNYDEPKLPLLMTDWFHDSAFEAIHGVDVQFPTILLNGTGNISNYDYEWPNGTKVVAGAEVPPKYQLHFEKEGSYPPRPPKRYLLRLINTSFGSTFIFSIDHHWLRVIEADFVPIEPYWTTHILVGIGQRYNVIVEAKPSDYGKGLPTDGNYWVRTTSVTCFVESITKYLAGYDTTGILRYDPTSTSNPTTDPWSDIPSKPACSDEPVASLVPHLLWEVDDPQNGEPWGEKFKVSGFNGAANLPDFPIAHFSFEMNSFNPLQINYSNPIFLNFDNHDGWPQRWVVVPENYAENDWVYLALTGGGGRFAHPIHLHGHDFAMLQQEYNKTLTIDNLHLNTHNPPRRDVVLLPGNGFVVIAFKTDNPGSWIMHCHIAVHASWGLALQILERQADANNLWPKHAIPPNPAIAQAERVCKQWRAWQSECENWWPGYDEENDCYPACPNNTCPEVQPPSIFMDDSGI